MRLLADENFPKQTIVALRAGGHDVLWARVDCPGWKDVALLEPAEAEGRILITLDKDFWQIAVQRRVPLNQAGVVLFRTHPATAGNLAPLVRTFIQSDVSWAAYVSIVSATGIQMMSVRNKPN